MNAFKRHWWPVFVVGVTLLALAVRWPNRSVAFSFDEWVTVRFTQLSWSEFWHYIRLENTPPLFFLLAKYWALLVPATEAWLRALALLFGILWLPALAALLRAFLKPAAAAFGLVLAALAAVAIAESSEFRTYSLTLLLSTVLLYSVIRWHRTNRPIWLMSISSAALLGTMSHMQFAIIILACQGYFVWSIRQHWLAWAMAWMPAAGAAVSWYLIVWRFHETYAIGPAWINHLSSTRLTQIQPWLGSLLPIHFGSSTPAVAVIALAAFVCTGLLVFAFRGQKQLDSSWRLPVLVVAIGVIVGFITTVDVPKYFIVVLPAGLLLLGHGWARLPTHRWRLIAGVTLIALVASQTPTTIALRGSGWRETARYLETYAEPGSLILVHPYPDADVLEHYYAGQARVVGLLPIRYQSTDRFTDTLRYNYQAVVRDDTLDDIAKITNGYDIVYFVTAVSNTVGFFNGNKPPEWFEANGWDGRTTVRFADERPFIIRYTRATE